MNRTIVAGLAAVAAVVCGGAAGADAKAQASQERHEKMLRATGGLLDVEPKGKVVVVNAQSRVASEVVKSLVKSLSDDLKMTVELAPSGDYTMYVRPRGATGAIVVADRDDLPMSVVAAERTWGLVNVAALAVADDSKTEARFKREFARVACFALGQSNSQFNGSPLCTVQRAEDLDSIVTDQMTFDAQMMVSKTLANLGMTKRRRTSYKKACQEGWAPAPTNDYQRAIWNQVHQIPDKPITIEFDPKKDK